MWTLLYKKLVTNVNNAFESNGHAPIICITFPGYISASSLLFLWPAHAKWYKELLLDIEKVIFSLHGNTFTSVAYSSFIWYMYICSYVYSAKINAIKSVTLQITRLFMFISKAIVKCTHYIVHKGNDDLLVLISINTYVLIMKFSHNYIKHSTIPKKTKYVTRFWKSP